MAIQLILISTNISNMHPLHPKKQITKISSRVSPPVPTSTWVGKDRICLWIEYDNIIGIANLIVTSIFHIDVANIFGRL
jgi:hypothetical protein